MIDKRVYVFPCLAETSAAYLLVAFVVEIWGVDLFQKTPQKSRGAGFSRNQGGLARIITKIAGPDVVVVERR